MIRYEDDDGIDGPWERAMQPKTLHGLRCRCGDDCCERCGYDGHCQHECDTFERERALDARYP